MVFLSHIILSRTKVLELPYQQKRLLLYNKN